MDQIAITDAVRKEQEAQKDLALQKAQAKISTIEANPYLTNAEKNPLLIQEQKDLSAELQRQLVYWNARADELRANGESTVEADRQTQKLNQDLEASQNKIAELADVNSFTGSLKRGMIQLKDSFGTVAQDLAATFTSVFAGINSGMQNSLSHFILYGGSLKSLFVGIYNSVATAFANSVAKMVSDWVVGHMLMLAKSLFFHTADNAAHLVSETTKTVTTTTAAGIRTTTRTVETVTSTGLTAADTATHAAGEGTKTGATWLGSAMRGVARLGETIFHGVMVAIRVASHIAGETASTAVTLVEAPIRAAALGITAIIGAISAMASIPYVGPILAVAAAAGMVALVASEMGAFAEGGRPEPGQLALVGERGPELFIPDVAGTIITADKTAAMLQGGGRRAADAGGPGASKTTVKIDTPIFFDMNKVVEHVSRSDAHEKRILDVLSRNIYKFR